LLSICLCAAGFKLDTLLKLADVKGTDRKTSLLHFVLDQLLKDSPAMHSLPHQLVSVKPAANLQVSPALSQRICHACPFALSDKYRNRLQKLFRNSQTELPSMCTQTK